MKTCGRLFRSDDVLWQYNYSLTDFLCPRLPTDLHKALHMLVTKKLVFAGFNSSSAMAKREISAAMLILREVKYTPTAVFELDSVQLADALMQTTINFPPFVGTLEIRLDGSLENPSDGVLLARALSRLSKPLNPCGELITINIHIRHMRNAPELIEQLFKVSTS